MDDGPVTGGVTIPSYDAADWLRTLPLPLPESPSVPISGPVLPYSAKVAFIEGNTGPNGLILARDPNTGAPIYHPDGPVRSGNGTVADPFVIEDQTWTMLSIKGTDAHLVLHNNSLDLFSLLVPLMFSLTTLGDPASFLLEDVENVILRENTLSGGYGIRLANARSVLFEGNTIYDTGGGGQYGIEILDSTLIDVIGNDIRHMPTGSIRVQTSDDILIRDNILSGDIAVHVAQTPATEISGNELVAYRNGGAYFGVLLDRSPHTSILDNTYSIEYLGGWFNGTYGGPNEFADIGIVRSPDAIVQGNSFVGPGIWILGDVVADYRHNIDGSNSLPDGRVHYHFGGGPLAIPADAAQVIVANASDVVIDGLEVSGGATGLHLAFVEGAVVTGLHAHDVRWGAHIEQSTNVVVQDVTVSGPNRGAVGIPFGPPSIFRDLAGSHYEPGAAVLLWHVENVMVFDLTAPGRNHLVDISASSDVEIGHVAPQEVFWGIYATASRDVRLHDLDIVGAANPIVLMDVAQADVRNVRITDCEASCIYAEVRDSTFEQIEASASIADGAFGVGLFQSSDNLVRDVEVLHGEIGLTVQGERNVITHTTLADGAIGAHFLIGNRDTRLEASEVRNNTVGIVTDGPCTTCEHHQGVTIVDNNIWGNTQVGLDVHDRFLVFPILTTSLSSVEPPLDARNNWWGCATGPGTTDCDSVSGHAETAPWRTTPNAHAGAS